MLRVLRMTKFIFKHVFITTQKKKGGARNQRTPAVNQISASEIINERARDERGWLATGTD